MGYTNLQPPYRSYGSPEYEYAQRRSSWVMPLGLFMLTLLTTLMAGAAWAGQDFLEVTTWVSGLEYSMLILTFLAAHEFGHYFAARYHGVDTTLPYFIPVPPLFLPFGTAGAVIRTQSPILSRKALFDIGVSGPLAGFVVSVVFLIIGFMTLPSQEYIYRIHPDYRQFGGAIPEYGLHFGTTLLYDWLANIFANPNGWLPPMNEMYHYPYLCVGWFGLFVTSMNLLPIGQLDGGHIAHAMFGEGQVRIGRLVWWCIAIMGLGSVLGYVYSRIIYDSPDALYMFFQSLLLPPLYALHRAVPEFYHLWSGWMVWALILRLFIRIEHPYVDDDEPLDRKRMILGFLAAGILLVSFCPKGIFDVERTEHNSVPRQLPRKNKGEIASVVQTKNAYYNHCPSRLTFGWESPCYQTAGHYRKS
ncbi:MAG: site-2 protease family protein [Bacteroidota bacterium]|nr:site-2 protease family protein [Candidatus Kapabacteria bacterium]MDW8220939.1 site-2 protease family protein [Bacteroidota bacterium]